MNPFQFSTIWIVIYMYSVVDHMKSSTFAFYLDNGPPSRQSENSSKTESESAQLDNLWLGWCFCFAFALLPWFKKPTIVGTASIFQVVRVVTVDGDTGRCKCVLRTSGEAIEVAFVSASLIKLYNVKKRGMHILYTEVLWIKTQRIKWACLNHSSNWTSNAVGNIGPGNVFELVCLPRTHPTRSNYTSSTWPGCQVSRKNLRPLANATTVAQIISWGLAHVESLTVVGVSPLTPATLQYFGVTILTRDKLDLDKTATPDLIKSRARDGEAKHGICTCLFAPGLTSCPKSPLSIYDV